MKTFSITRKSDNQLLSYGSFSTKQAKKKAKEYSKIFGEVVLLNVKENRVLNF